MPPIPTQTKNHLIISHKNNPCEGLRWQRAKWRPQSRAEERDTCVCAPSFPATDARRPPCPEQGDGMCEEQRIPPSLSPTPDTLEAAAPGLPRGRRLPQGVVPRATECGAGSGMGWLSVPRYQPPFSVRGGAARFSPGTLDTFPNTCRTQRSHFHALCHKTPDSPRPPRTRRTARSSPAGTGEPRGTGRAELCYPFPTPGAPAASLLPLSTASPAPLRNARD